MERFYSDGERSLNEIRFAAIAIKLVHGEDRHLGILHRTANAETVLLLNLAFHFALRNDSPNSSYFWVDPPIHPSRARQVAAFCRIVWKRVGTRLPYAFSMPSDCFDASTGEFRPEPNMLGLTCATFVLAIFHSAGLPLIDYTSWPANRPGDEDWQSRILALLEAHASPEHVQAVTDRPRSIRYRPEEVAAAGTSNTLPATFSYVEPISREILKRIGRT